MIRALLCRKKFEGARFLGKYWLVIFDATGLLHFPERLKKEFPRLPVCVLADSLYASESVSGRCLHDNHWHIFTVTYGEDESEYYYLTIDWIPNTIIRELTDNAETTIATLPAHKKSFPMSSSAQSALSSVDVPRYVSFFRIACTNLSCDICTGYFRTVSYLWKSGFAGKKQKREGSHTA